MAAEAIKFRCDRCGQLLGVSPSRAGRPVKCPKCGAGLVVPSPGLGTSSPPEAGPVFPTSSEESGIPAGGPIAFDPIGLDPEDVRAVFRLDPEAPKSPSEVLPIAFDEEDDLAESAPDLQDDAPPGPQPVVAFDPEPPSITTDPGATRRDFRGSAVLESTPVVPEARPRSGRDVVMPRVGFIAWSLFVLLALFLAFVAGLLVGHFVWAPPA